MGKDSNKSNSDLIQRLKTLLAESEQRPGNQPTETEQEPVEEADRTLLKSESDEPHHPLPDLTGKGTPEETDPDVSTVEAEIQPSEPAEDTSQDILEPSISSAIDTEIQPGAPAEENRDALNEPTENPPAGDDVEIPQEAPVEEAFPFEGEKGIPELKPAPVEIDRNPPGEVPRDFKSIGTEAESRQKEPLEEVRQEPERIELGDSFKTKLREGVNMPQVGNYVVNYKNIVVKTSDGSVISGKTNIDAFGRLTEYLKQGTDRFITVFSEDAGDASKQVTIVNKDHIIWANTWD